MKRLIKYSHWIIFVVGWVISGWAAFYVHEQIERKAQDSFNLRVQDMEAAVVRRLRSYEDLLYGIAGLYQVTGNVTPEQFDTYGNSLDFKERYPSLLAINFAKYFTRNALGEFVQNYESDTGGRGMASRLSLPETRSEYMVLTRAYPAELLPTLGTDVFQNVMSRIAPANGKSIAVGSNYYPNKVFSSGVPITPPGRKMPALAARLGVFRLGEDKGPKLIGTVGIGFDLAQFFKESIPRSLVRTIHYRMTNIGRYDGKKHSRSKIVVFDSRSVGTGIDPDKFRERDLFRKHFDVLFGGAILRIEVAESSDATTGEYEKYLPFAVCITGCLFFTGIGLSCRRILSDNAALDAVVGTIKKQTIELQCEINRTKSLERELAAVIDSERTRIGRELHDDLGQRLTAISVSAEILSAKLLTIDPRLAAQADDLGRATSEAMMQIRTLVQGLMPVAPDREGLRDALTDLTAEVSRLSGIHCTFDFDDPVTVADESVATHLYRIAQEALNNAIRHARARVIELRLDEIDGKVSLSIADDGCGFDPARRTGGFGLNTIAYRASIIGYHLHIVSSVGNGTMIKVTEC